MKTKYLFIVIAFAMGVFISGCENWETYENPGLASPPQLTMELVSVQDSTITVSAETSVKGYISMVVTDDSTITASDIDAETLIEGNVSGIEGQLFKVENGPGTINYSFSSGLIQNSWYQVFAVASNVDGMLSEVQNVEVMTDDSYAPQLKDVSPARSSVASQENSFSVDLTFSEPVQVVDTAMFHFSYYFDDEVVPVDSLSVDKNIVTIYQKKVPHNGEWVFLSWEEGAVTDFLAGSPNPVEAQVSGVIDNALAGLYWRVQHVPFGMTVGNFYPESGSATSDPQLDIIYKFPFDVTYATDAEGDYAYTDGDVEVTFWQEGKQVVLDIPFSNISVGDSTLVIALTEPADFGNTVSVNIAEGVVEDMYGNPNEAFESDNTTGANWLVSYGYTRDMIIGTYLVDGVSYLGGDYNESFEVTIEEDPDDENQVIVTGMYYSEVPITAVFDGDFATLTFNLPLHDYGFYMIDIGDIFGEGDGSFSSLEEAYGNDHFVCHIDADGNMYTDDEYLWASYYYGVSADGWNNIFEASTWTKMETGTATPLKSARSDKKKILHNDVPRTGLIKNN